jgi:Ca2+-transporting ATPase
MDSLAALALATDPPTEEVLDRQPESKRSPLITVPMWKMMLGQSIFQVVLVLVLLKTGYSLFGWKASVESDALMRSFIFNLFVYFQVFNMLNCRRIDSHLNFLSGIHRNYYFLVIFVMINICQVIIMQYGGVAFSTVPINGAVWGASIGFALITFPVGVIMRLLPSWDGCTILGIDIARPDNTRVYMTKERLQWHDTVGKVRTQLSVFRALRGNVRQSMSRSTENMDERPSTSLSTTSGKDIHQSGNKLVTSSMDAIHFAGADGKNIGGFTTDVLE